MLPRLNNLTPPDSVSDRKTTKHILRGNRATAIPHAFVPNVEVRFSSSRDGYCVDQNSPIQGNSRSKSPWSRQFGFTSVNVHPTYCPPGRRFRRLHSVSAMSRAVAQCPDLPVGRSGMSTTVHRGPFLFQLVDRQLTRPGLVSRTRHYSILRRC